VIVSTCYRFCKFSTALCFRSPSFTLRNLVIDNCNTNTSVIQLDPDCGNEGTMGSARFHGLIIQRNVMLEQGRIINSSNARCLQLELNNISIRRNRCVGPCILLSANNTLNSIALERNKRSNSNSKDFSIFASVEASETVAINMRSEKNEIESFRLTSSILRIANSLFSYNRGNISFVTRDTSFFNGGVLFTNQSLVFISNTTFERNYALYGGALSVWSSSVSIEECIFRENDAVYGGSLDLYESSHATILGTLFSNNTARRDAGAIHLGNGVSLSVHDSIFEGSS